MQGIVVPMDFSARRRSLAGCIAIGMLVGAIGDAASQEFPSRPLTMIIPFPAGGPADGVGRLIAARAAASLGQPVVVENVPGAGGSLGTSQLAKSRPDGYTIGLVGSMHVANAFARESLPYDPLKDFEAIGLVAYQPYVLVVAATVPAKSVSELVSLAKQRAEKLAFGSPGVGTFTYSITRSFVHLAQVAPAHVAFKSSTEALANLTASRIEFMFLELSIALPAIRSEKLRALAVSGSVRVPALPSVPTLIEAGLREFQYTGWVGVVAPAKLPPAIRDRISSEIRKAVEDRDVRAKLETTFGMVAAGSSANEFRQFLVAEAARWPKVRALCCGQP